MNNSKSRNELATSTFHWRLLNNDFAQDHSVRRQLYMLKSHCLWLLVKGFVKVKSVAEIRNDAEDADGMDRCR